MDFRDMNKACPKGDFPLTRDCLNVLGSIGEESSTSFIGMIFIREESSTSLLKLRLDVVLNH